MTVCEAFFKLKFSKIIQNISTLQSLGRFLFIVWIDIPKIMNLLTDFYQAINTEKNFSIIIFQMFWPICPN